MQREPLSPLPIRLAPGDDESIISLLYRTAQANGMDLQHLRQWLGLPYWVPLPTRSCPALAWISGVSTAWLARRAIQATLLSGAQRYLFMDHEFGKGSINFACRARICPFCVKRQKYMRAAWQLRTICGCIEHACILMDSCPVCGALLDWQRPAIDICRCGRFLTAPAQQQPPLPERVSNWIRWNEVRLENPETTIPAETFGLPKLLSPLSIDGALRFVLSIGLQPHPAAMEHADDRRHLSSKGTCALVGRALGRLSAIGDQPDNLASLGPLAHQPALERLRSHGISESDRRFAAWLLAILREGRDAASGSGRRQRGQLSLFE